MYVLDSVVIWFFAPSGKNRTWCFWFLALIIRRNKSRLSEYGCYVRVNCRVVKVKALKFSLRIKELLMQISKSVPMERGIAHVFCPHWLQEHSSTEKKRTKFNFWEISWKPGYILDNLNLWTIMGDSRIIDSVLNKKIQLLPTFWTGLAILLWCSWRFVKVNKRSIRTFLAAFSNVADIIGIKSSCKAIFFRLIPLNTLPKPV